MAGVCRFDKYHGIGGGFRAPLTAAIVANQVGTIIAVSVATATGRITVGGAAADDLIGVIVPTEPMDVGAVIDVMQNGEIVGDVLTLGSKVWGHLDGSVDNTATAGKYLGQKVATAGATAPRVIVRVRPGAA